MRERPIGVTILAILAGIAAVLAAIHRCAKFLRRKPEQKGEVNISGTSSVTSSEGPVDSELADARSARRVAMNELETKKRRGPRTPNTSNWKRR